MEAIGSEGIRLIVASRTWLTNITPHCLGKANRIDFGLLSNAIASGLEGADGGSDSSGSDASGKRVEPPSRRFLAVPFVALDTPSPSSEFAQPDVRIAMTFLAFRYEGLRAHDTRSLVDGLKRDLVREQGPVHLRQSYCRFDRWLAGGSTAPAGTAAAGAEQGGEEAGLLDSRPVAPGLFPDADNGCGGDDDDDVGQASASALNPVRRAASAGAESVQSEWARAQLAADAAVRQRAVLPLDLMQTSDAAQSSRCHTALRRNSDAIGYYLRTKVLPAVLRAQAERLSASGVDVAGGTMFRRRVGFSGTPSNLLPRGMRCEFEPGSEAEIATVLTSPSVLSVHVMDKQWSARSLLRWFAQHDPPLHALIDAGALITNMSNVEIARELLRMGLKWARGVVFVDASGRKRILLRGQEDSEGSDLAGSDHHRASRS